MSANRTTSYFEVAGHATSNPTPHPARPISPPTRAETPGRHADRFERLAAWTVQATGGRWGFRLAMLAFVAWVASGP